MRGKRWNTMMKAAKRGLALLLFACLFTQDCFMSLAGTNKAVSVELTETSNTDVSTDSEITSADILYEITEKRDEYTKHFQLADGTIMAVTYQDKVHYLEDGEYKEINAALVSETQEGEEVLASGAGVLPVKFANKSGKKLLTIGKGNSKLKVTLSRAEKVKAEELEIAESDLTDGGVDERMIVTTKSTVIYRDILKNTDIAYISGSESVKENIILKSSEVPDSYTFTYTGKDLTYQMLENGDTELYLCGGEEVSYTIAAPFMVDAEGKYSSEIEVSLAKEKDTLYVTLTPSQEFLQAEDTVYPVIIDPPISTPEDYEAIKDTFVSETQPDSNTVGQHGSFLVGKSYTYGTCHGYIKFNSLPTLSAGDVIVQAYFSLWQYDFSAVGEQEFCIAAYENTGDWDETVTWNTAPGYDEAVDYTFVGPCYNSEGAACYYERMLDITKLVRKWYAGENYGVMLASLEDRYAEARFFTSDYPFGTSESRPGSSEQYPSGIFIYRNTNGVEDYWSYHSASTTLGTTGLVNDATGALTMVNTDVSENGNVMPFTFTRTYNINNLWTEPTHGIRSGIGWTTNLNQYLYWITLGDTSYCVYVDADGTSHYICDTGDGWWDEDGLGLKLDFEMGDYAITDKNGDSVRFSDVNGKIYPYMIQESEGNKIDIHYDSGDYNKPDRVTDGVGRTFTFSYNSDGRLESVTDPASRITTYTYDASEGRYLERITYADGEYTSFDYNIGNSDKSITVLNKDGSGLRYYTNASSKVTSAQEIGTDGSTRALYNITYPAVNVMRYTYANGLSEDYQSDDFGRVISITNSEGYGVYTGFTTTENNSIANNKTTFVSNVQKSVANLALNGCAEDGEEHWEHEGWGSYSGVSASRSTDAKLGNYAWQITKESGEGTYHKRSYLDVGKGKTYTLSGYIKTNLASSDGIGGAKLYAAYQDDEGVMHHVYSEPVISTGSEWKRVSVTFTNMQWTTQVYIFAGITDGASGTALFDNIQLEEGEVANRYNVIENGSFEREFANVTTNGNASIVSGSSPTGGSNKHVKVTGDPEMSCAGVAIQPNLNIPANTNVVVSAYAKATAAPMNPTDDVYTGNQLNGNPRLFGLEVTAYYTDGSSYKQAIKFNEDLTSDSWQYLSGVFNLSYEGNRECGKTVSYVTVRASYDGQINAAQFDLLSLYVEEFGTEYAYDSDGNLVSSVDAASQANTYLYGDNNLKQLLSPTGSNYEYGYDSHHKVTDSTSAEGIRSIIKYDNFGNPIYTITQGESRNESLTDGNIYYIKNAQTGKYLEVLNSQFISGNSVVQSKLSRSQCQMWQLNQNTDGSYTLSPYHAPNLYLATSGAVTVTGTAALLSDSRNDSTSFQIERTGNGTYNIKMKTDTDQVLEIASSYGVNGQCATIGAMDDKTTGAMDQQWYFEQVSNSDLDGNSPGYCSDVLEEGEVYYIKSVFNDRYLECNGTTEGDTVGQNVFTGEISQKFLIRMNGCDIHIIPIELEEEGLELAIRDEENSSLVLSGPNEIFDGYYMMLSEVSSGVYRLYYVDDDSYSLALSDNALTYENATPESKFLETGSQGWWVFEKAGAYMESKAEYTDDGNYLSKITASDGRSTTYDYDEVRGTLDAVTEPGNVTIGYDYDESNDMLKKVTQGNSSVSYLYDNRKLKEIVSPSGTSYLFLYNAFNQRSGTSIGNRTLATYAYDNLGRVIGTTYGNGDTAETTYDILSRVTSIRYDGAEKVSYLYDNDGNVSRMTDAFSNQTITYAYDSVKRLVSMNNSNGYSLGVVYDNKNRVSEMTESIDVTEIEQKVTEYTYNSQGIIDHVMTTQNGEEIFKQYQFDELYRVYQSQVGFNSAPVVNYAYRYTDGELAGSTTSQVEELTVNNKTYTYTYDDRGNITQISLNGSVKATYVYDEYDRLVSETVGGITTTWTYDAGGNILTRSRNGNTIEYKYEDSEWKDLLTTYNGQSITYDAIGNPLSIGTDTTFTWEAGRRLSSVTKSGVTTSFIYNKDGYRTSKTTNGVTTNYYLNGDTITAMTVGTNELSFTYDENGLLVGLYYNGIPYAYAKNLQGDIIGILDEDGNWVVSYEYNAWGNMISVSGGDADGLGSLNPFRYRGYVYDEETGLYYLQSRYYDPEIGRNYFF